MSIQSDLEMLAKQEALLQFDKFDASTAWDLGCALRAVAEAKSAVVAVHIQLGEVSVFSFSMVGTTPDNNEWLRRKRNVVQRFYRSSYAVGLGLQQRETSLLERYGLSVTDYAAHGGCFPIRVKGVGVVGSIGLSGLAQRDDHEMLVEAIARYLKLPYEDVRLPAE
ncbi:heme-degrading domain-containing protein [Uliginosibacterium gangwonense]|uniref:heme-degrading domain-containing protein n=1 Tax=Uliginosibacterium gangwonense TaxID=392736 RepID=UPI00036B7722|nr:heme-degrading domain-containing protein [Uliginosibacterium gangwonense]